ncbi:hypothetical protein DENIS_3483 [Desulfonema ishimotonii]|uniref:Uncharacterized protein n=1 Tax=Desulfonema ishimotonii TaxID=45657 RepID=A0A401FZW3_9BACT|nr:hypothetical protein [Desulfonema ishimotonii]GBC62511.1 hypothetical protein DENIS_3483 [Desulfonema ishimotonii]
MTGKKQASCSPRVKTCTRCGQTKPLDSFPWQSNTRDGRGHWCKACEAEHFQQKRRDMALELTLDFSRYPDLLESVCAIADAECRTPDQQVIYFLKYNIHPPEKKEA